MKKGTLVHVRTPRGAVKEGRFVQSHETAFGPWLEVAPVDIDGKVIKTTPTFRARPASVTAA